MDNQQIRQGVIEYLQHLRLLSKNKNHQGKSANTLLRIVLKHGLFDGARTAPTAVEASKMSRRAAYVALEPIAERNQARRSRSRDPYTNEKRFVVWRVDPDCFVRFCLELNSAGLLERPENDFVRGCWLHLSKTGSLTARQQHRLLGIDDVRRRCARKTRRRRPKTQACSGIGRTPASGADS